ncbi:MAG TPA: ribosome biogenesis GTPase YlqF [Clostridiales bacterium]|nr:ribosome biogenesis GTPase YlqF [Clostridiales bacterium]
MIIESINWYPGHMKKTRELIRDHLKAVDCVIEVIDARIPLSSRNPIVDELIGGRPRVVLLNKADLAEEKTTVEWAEHLTTAGTIAWPVNSLSGQGLSLLPAQLQKLQKTDQLKKPDFRPLRLMIAGVPNVGKSSLINRLTGRKATQTGDRPGVTKGKQWLTLANGMKLLDTPGILWPKFEDPRTGLNLALCGSIKDEILDPAEMGLALLRALAPRYGDLLIERYKLDELPEDALEAMELIARKRGFLLSGGRIDYERTGRTLLDEFRAGQIGRISLERPDDEATEPAGAE